MNRDELRCIVRAKRRALSYASQRQASRKLLLRLSHLPLFTQSQTQAFYIANDGEISPDLAIDYSRRAGGKVVLPCLGLANRHAGALQFRLFADRGSLTKNRFGIPEPKPFCPETASIDIDVVFLPLVAFDKSGNRLGMGGGFYDRTFAYKRKFPAKGPKLIGLAHECQEVDNLDVELWDIPLDFIVTDMRVIRTGK